MANRLAESLSPYLRQHADNPVHWQEWGDSALAEARGRDVPILLSVATPRVTGAMSWRMNRSRTMRPLP